MLEKASSWDFVYNSIVFQPTTLKHEEIKIDPTAIYNQPLGHSEASQQKKKNAIGTAIETSIWDR